MAEQNRGVTEDVRRQRHESRTGQTFAAFVRDLCSQTGLSEEESIRAGASVLTHLERRLTAEEASDLNAQLPIKLQEIISEAGRSVQGRVDKFDKDDFVERIASNLDKEPGDAEALIRAVFTTLRMRISEGEANDVAAQLPKDLEALWSRPI